VGWNLELLVLLGLLGLVTGFLSGLLGIGGGIVMAPLLLYIPPLAGLTVLPMRTVAGLTIVQGLAACISGALTHRRFHFVSGRLTLWMGGTILAAALAGGVGAGFVANEVLLAVFAALAIIASVLAIIPNRTDSETPDIEQLDFSVWRSVATAGGVGFFGGLVGQGGSFILIPLLTSFVRIPTRIAIGTNLAIVFLSSLAAFLGKALTGQIEWALALPIVLTVIPAAHLGGKASCRLPVAKLRLFLFLLIAAAAMRLALAAIG